MKTDSHLDGEWWGCHCGHCREEMIWLHVCKSSDPQVLHGGNVRFIFHSDSLVLLAILALVLYIASFIVGTVFAKLISHCTLANAICSFNQHRQEV